MIEWIKCSNRLPEETDYDCLFLVAKKVFAGLFLKVNKYRKENIFFEETWGEHELDEVTHWAPINLPEDE